jgi:imidazolonepropionase-like amidohydrolase
MKNLMVVLLLAAVPFVPATAAQDVVAFENVNVLPMDTPRVLERQTVIVRGTRIVEVGPAGKVAVPKGALRVDGRDRYLMPGLSDMHGHLPPGEGVNDDAVSQYLQLYLANGVTLVRGMVGSPGNLVVRDKIARGELAGPTIVAASAPLHQKTVPTPEAGTAAVEAAKAAGFDLIKVHEGLTPAAYAAITETARRLGMKVAGHVTATVGLVRALAARQSSIEHLDGYLQALVPKDAKVEVPPGQVLFGPVLEHMDETRIPALARATREAGVWNTPTLALFGIVMSSDSPEHFAAWPEMKYVSPQLRAAFAKQKAGTAGIPATPEDRQRYLDLRNKVVKALADAGALLLVGPDTPQLFLVPGFATHREMAAFVEAGLTPFQALQAATTSAAEYLGRGGEAGKVETGMRADLLLTNANPLTDIRNAGSIAGVMANGRWMPKTDLDAMLSRIESAHAGGQ